jgi:hypothetical protein
MFGGNSTTTVVLGGPGALGGLTQLRTNFLRGGSTRGRFTGSGGWYAQSSVPHGYRPPYSVIIAQKPGGMAHDTYAWNIDGTVSGNLAGGLNATATIGGTGTISSADMSLIASAVATITAGGDLSASVIGKLEAFATIGGTGDLSADTTAIGHATATIAGEGDMAATMRATGELDADIQPYTELSPESLARAVWTLQQAGFTDPGSFGANLDAPISTIGGGSITEEGIAAEVLDVLMTDPRFLTVAKFLGLK